MKGQQTRHTPGPYKVARTITGKSEYAYQPDKEHEPNCWRAIIAGPEFAIAQVSGETEAEALATARFFVRACNAHDELLSALKAFCEDHTKPCGCENCAIIARAEKPAQR